MSAPLGVRIHNPGNIRWSHWSSAQPGAVQAVEGFVEFTSVYDGPGRTDATPGAVQHRPRL